MSGREVTTTWEQMVTVLVALEQAWERADQALDLDMVEILEAALDVVLPLVLPDLPDAE